ncbi:Mediator complex subunit Med4 [Penicillium taxi]|uniref:Mediator complex subunit Med4 n=1 Tax=Penicillium taxi TaxID=168475 RepID=UPI0025455869|nr:Mediator complex subunit Med4 [Penicillium taxi]KAJ5884695.1 Mediator complex subunit Med4 [Penicillium taxi]
MNTAIQNSLSDVESKLNALLTELLTSPAAAVAPACALALLQADDNLSTTIKLLRTHQENYAKILQLRKEAEQLDDRVKGIVLEIEAFDKEIKTACGDDEESDSDAESEYDEETGDKKPATLREIDYALLLDFARRISKYNHEAAADAANGAANGAPTQTQIKLSQQVPDNDVKMTDNGEAAEGAEPVSSVTKGATQWLDDSANITREVYMMPYPTEERIRMGLMGQAQLVAGEDLDKEVDRLLREAEGLGAAEPPAPAPTVNTIQDESAKAAAQAGSMATTKPSAPAPAPEQSKPKPKATLDLDLYDPDDDDF